MTKTTEKRLVQMPAVEHIKSIKQKLREAKSKYEHNTGASKPLTAYSLHKLLEEKELPTLAISALQNMFNPELNSKTIDVTMVAILLPYLKTKLCYQNILPITPHFKHLLILIILVLLLVICFELHMLLTPMLIHVNKIL